ncbi:MAG: thermonuclease family protein [Candidatus Solibacter sp.]
MICRRLFLLAIAAVALYAEDFSGKVVAITDGDTIKVMHDGALERIRLWGIDCPESKQAFGTRAKQLTGDLAFGKIVTVKVRDIDRYKRTVAEIILPDGRNQTEAALSACLLGENGWCVRFHFLRLRVREQHVDQLRRKLLRANAIIHGGEGGRATALPLKFDGNRLKLVGEPNPLKLREGQYVLAAWRNGANGLLVMG